MPDQSLPFRAILFDMDGVLVDSNPAIEASWQVWADKHDLDFAAVKARIHGRKAVEVIRHFLPDADIETVEQDWPQLRHLFTLRDGVGRDEPDGRPALLNIGGGLDEPCRHIIQRSP